MKSVHLSRMFALVVVAILVVACASPDRTSINEGKYKKLATKPEGAVVTDRATLSQAYAPVAIAKSEMRSSVMNSYPGRIPYYLSQSNTEKYAHITTNRVQQVAEHPVSTFGIDVDTGSYANVRRMLMHGQLPPADAVRIEEMVNYFDYSYLPPANRDRPFKVDTEIAPTPWNPNTHLLRIGVKGYDVRRTQVPPANLVFLVDVSGSMRAPNKLELLKSALTLLVQQLGKRDRVSLVVYAGASGIVLEPTAGNHRAKIISALNRLSAGGSTNGESGIKLAYEMAQQGFIQNGINRVILATDGDFNVGVANVEALRNLVEDKRKTGITLTTLGFGMGNYNDNLMEQLADVGNGNYAYIDNLNEARKVLVQQMTSTLFTIAKDVKVQIEFNPVTVSEYRLLGYENRSLRREDFNNDRVDAGDIGAGHTVTALYEITLVGHKTSVDPLRYGKHLNDQQYKNSELAYLRMRYKSPNSHKSELMEWSIPKNSVRDSLSRADKDFRFAAAVAGFAELLRGGNQMGSYRFQDVINLASRARGSDPFGYRGEFINLVSLAQSLSSGKAQDGQNIQERQ